MKAFLFPITVHQARVADFPLECDCILKVRYKPTCGIRFQYFASFLSCADEFKYCSESLAMVSEVKIIPIEEFND